jgi:hypothetical protein
MEYRSSLYYQVAPFSHLKFGFITSLLMNLGLNLFFPTDCFNLIFNLGKILY